MTLAQRIALVILGLVLTGAAGLVVWMSGREARLARASATWTQITGRVESSDVRSTWVKQASSSYLLHSAEVKYSYEVEGTRHHASRIGFSDEWLGAPGNTGRARATEQAARFPAGSELPVYINPDDPREATLVPGGSAPFTSSSGLVVGVLMLMAALGCIVAGLKWKT